MEVAVNEKDLSSPKSQPNEKERLEIKVKIKNFIIFFFKLSNLKKNIRNQQSESFSPTKKPGYDT